MMMNGRFNRRHSPNRRNTRVEALCHIEGTVERIIIVDVSYQGMKISVPENIPPGTAVTIEVMGERIPAIVHWSKSGFAGLHMLTRMERETLLALESADDDLAAFR